MTASTSPASIVWDGPAIQQMFGDCLMVADGVATTPDGKRYRINATANRFGKRADVQLRHLSDAKRGHAVPETQCAAIRAAALESAIAHFHPTPLQTAERRAKVAQVEMVAGGRAPTSDRPYRVQSRTSVSSVSWDFATLDEARQYVRGQIESCEGVRSGGAPVRKTFDPSDSFILWADGAETVAALGWTFNPADPYGDWIKAEQPATAESDDGLRDCQGNPVRRDNVEYHAGRAARRAGVAITDCPYLSDGVRAARWNLGWNDSDASERDADAVRPRSDATRLTLIAAALDSCGTDLRALASTRGMNSVPAIERRDAALAAIRAALA